jgi:hypothetical protein
VRWGKNLGFPVRTQGELAKGAPKTKASCQEERPSNKTEGASDRGAVGKKLGVSRGSARRVGERGHPKPRRVGKRSTQPTKPKEPATEVRWGKNLGFLEATQGEFSKGAPKTKASWQEERPTKKKLKGRRQRFGGEKTWGFQWERKASLRKGHPKPRRVGKRSAQPKKLKEPVTEVRWGKNLGFTEGTQGELAKGAPKTKASWQEERQTNKIEGASDRGAVGKKLGVSRGNARRVGEGGTQNQGELARGAPNQQNRRSQRQRCGGEKTQGFQRERKASW